MSGYDIRLLIKDIFFSQAGLVNFTRNRTAHIGKVGKVCFYVFMPRGEKVDKNIIAEDINIIIHRLRKSHQLMICMSVRKVNQHHSVPIG